MSVHWWSQDLWRSSTQIFLKIYFWSNLLYHTRIPILNVCTLLFTNSVWIFQAPPKKVSVPINAISIPNGTPKLKFKGEDLPPMSLNSPARLLSSSALSNFSSAIASTVMNAQMERMQYCTWLIAWQKEKPTENPKLGTYFISFPVAAQSWMLLWFIFNTLKSLGICNMLWTRYKLIAQPYLFFFSIEFFFFFLLTFSNTLNIAYI